MSEFQVNAEEELRRMEARTVQVAGMTYKLTRSAIHALRVMAAVQAAKRKECRAAQEFTKQFGSHTGYLQIKTEDEKVLQNFEQRLKTEGMEYAKLPNLQPGAGVTQYMYNLDKLDCLNGVIHEYEADRLSELRNLKAQYGDTEKYQIAKLKLQEQMPDIQLITVEDYARTAYMPNGNETEEFKAINESAKQAELAAGKGLAADDKSFSALLKDLDLNSKIANGSLTPVTVPELKFDTLTQAGKKNEIAVVPLKSEGLTLVLPKSAAMSSGKVLLDPSKTYRIIQDVTKKIIPIPGARIISLIADVVKKLHNTVQQAGQAHETVMPDIAHEKVRSKTR